MPLQSSFLLKLRTITRSIAAHKILVAVAACAILGGGYYAYQTYASEDSQTRYVLGTVEKKTVIASISASGQVSSSDEAEIKTKAAGDIVSVSVKEGQKVTQGQVLARIDATSAASAVRDAEIAVEEAEINLEQGSLQAPIDLKKLEEDVERAKRDVIDAYDDAYSALADAFINLPDIVTGEDSILYDYDISQNQENVSAYPTIFISVPDDQYPVQAAATRADTDYKAAREAYTQSTAAFRSLSRSSGKDTIKEALATSKNMAGLLAKAAVSETNLIDTTVDILTRRDWNIVPAITSAQTDARSYVTAANGVLSTLTTAQKALDSAEDALVDAEHALELGSVGNSADSSFDVKLLQNTLKQKQAALADAQQDLADRVIRAPFSGTLATFDLKRGDSVATGEAAGTLITDLKMAELSLNEVDAAQLKEGDKATLTFDAIEGLTLTGQVAEIDSVGTVTQGVVSYTVKIALDSQDERVKPGMTVNAAIIIEAHQDVLAVPSSAVKSQGNTKYVLAFNPPLSDTGGTQGATSEILPVQIPVEVGISDDTSIEIISGLSEGQQIVTRTISGTVTTNTTTSGTGGAGGNRTFGGPPGGAVFIR